MQTGSTTHCAHSPHRRTARLGASLVIFLQAVLYYQHVGHEEGRYRPQRNQTVHVQNPVVVVVPEGVLVARQSELEHRHDLVVKYNLII